MWLATEAKARNAKSKGEGQCAKDAEKVSDLIALPSSGLPLR